MPLLSCFASLLSSLCFSISAASHLFFLFPLFSLQLVLIYRHGGKALEILRGGDRGHHFLSTSPTLCAAFHDCVTSHVCRKWGLCNLPCLAESGESCSHFLLFCGKTHVFSLYTYVYISLFFLFISRFLLLSTWTSKSRVSGG